MKIEDLIPTDDICMHYHVERHFIHALHKNEIIHIETVQGKEYIPAEKINEFERMRRLHYEMNINIEGLEIVQNLLEKLNKMQREKQELLNRLHLYE